MYDFVEFSFKFFLAIINWINFYTWIKSHIFLFDTHYRINKGRKFRIEMIFFEDTSVKIATWEYFEFCLPPPLIKTTFRVVNNWNCSSKESSPSGKNISRKLDKNALHVRCENQTVVHEQWLKITNNFVRS